MLQIPSGNVLFNSNVPGAIAVKDGRWFIRFRYDKRLVEEIKSMTGARWNPENKLWHVDICHHNQWQLNYLLGHNPYARYDQPLIPVELANVPRTNRLTGKLTAPYPHQQEMTSHLWTRRCSIIAGEMGVGKSLSDILCMENAKLEFGWADNDFWYVAPKSVLKTIEREIYGWDSKVKPVLMTYDEVRSRMKGWVGGVKAPRFVTFDEAAMLKTPTSQRSQAAAGLTDGMRNDWGDEMFIALLTGTPAPKSPIDWWNLVRVACPGFLKEGDIYKLQRRLGIVEMQNNLMTGGQYPKLLGWKDNADRCEKCGRMKADPIHDTFDVLETKTHKFVPTVNEIQKLYERLKGLVFIKFKKDCLALPDKVYQVREVKPTQPILRMASLITKSAPTTIEALTRLRELSDGFQYRDKITGKEECRACKGTGKGQDFEEVPQTCPNCRTADPTSCLSHQPEYKPIEGKCHKCGGRGQVDVIERTVSRVACPKDDLLRDCLEENDEVGRMVVFAGFTESVDRCCDIAKSAGWSTIRLDGRGWLVRDHDGVTQTLDPLAVFQDRAAGQIGATFEKVCFVAHPGSGGFGHTLTAASMVVYYSNDFNGNYRTQSEDRIHRPGMDLNRGATIVDLIHLPTDLKVLQNLQAKRQLELATLGEFSTVLSAALAAPNEERLVT